MTSQTVDVIAGFSVLLLLLVWRVRLMFRPAVSLLDNPLVFFLMVCGAILIVHWPLIVWHHSINPDEEQMLAQAMRFLAHPVPWRDVDGTTSGPLNSMFLTVPMLLGAAPGWETARLILWAASSMTLICLYLALRCFGTRSEAQFVLLPTILFYACLVGRNFAPYTSETLPVLLLSAGVYLLCKEWRAPQTGRVRLFLLGLITGSIPFAKLQVTPLALFLFVIGLTLIIVRHREAGWRPRIWWREAGGLCLGAAAVPALLLGWVAMKGALMDFWISYILTARSYAQEAYGPSRLANVWKLFAAESDITLYLACGGVGLAGLLGAFFARKEKLGPGIFWPLVMVMVGLVLTLFCFFAAGKPYQHYLQLLIPVVALFLGLAFFAGKQLLAIPNDPGSDQGMGPAHRFLALSLLVLGPQLYPPIRYLRLFEAIYPPALSAEISAPARYVLAASKPGDSLAVWGWMPTYYVETGLMPATRDAIGHYVITEGPSRDFFRRRYLADLRQSKPPIFIDAVAQGAFLWWTWKPTDVHEGYPELDAFINENYAFGRSFPLADEGVPVRVYLLKSRLLELQQASGQVDTSTNHASAAPSR